MVVTIWNVVGDPQNAVSTQLNTLKEFGTTVITNLTIYLVFLLWGLKLSAIAVTKQTHYKPVSSFKFGDSWRYTKQHFTQVLLVALTISTVFATLEMLQATVFVFVVDMKTAIGMMLFIAFGYVQMIFTVGVLSELYKALVPVAIE